jgi:hypothetical protein
MALHSRLVFNGCVAALLCIAGAVTVASAQEAPVRTASSRLAALAVIPSVVDCGSLASADISAAVGAPTTITSAMVVQDGKPAPYCDVKGNVAPHVGFEVHLPLAGWTQRFFQVGCGGLCGAVRIDPYKDIAVTDSCVPVTNGELVLAGTDMGHSGTEGSNFSIGAKDYQARIDFAYRGEHVTALAAKALIAKYYGQEPKYSYFVGCSDGGREGIMEAMRFPRDFNGIISGDPALNWVTQNTFFQASTVHINAGADGKAILTEDKLPILHQAALDKCDAADGVRDGLISDPLACRFDPAVTLCKPGQDPSKCLTAEQVRAAKDIYSGVHDSKGNKFIPGGTIPGSELNWGMLYAPPAGKPVPYHPVGDGAYKYFVYEKNPPENASATRDLKFDGESFQALTKLRGLYDATDPDLASFASAGGKLIMYHGLNNPGMSVMNTLDYYTAVQKFMGKPAVDGFLRLYLFPGGNHCTGGAGPFNVDLLTPLMAWVEGGEAPYRIVASHKPEDKYLGIGEKRPPNAPPAADIVDMTRPVYPYPLTAKYTGKGSTNDEKNFVEGPASPVDPELLKWMGSSFYVPHYELWCTANGDSMTCKKTP